MSALDPSAVDAVLSHMNDDHAADSLDIVRAHGYPGATAAEMTGVDGDGGTWHVVDAIGEASVRIVWRGGPVTTTEQVREAVVALHSAATSAERASLAMGEHGALRYADPTVVAQVRPTQERPAQERPAQGRSIQ